MHILFTSQYFPPEMGAPAARVFELARRWVACGHRVTVITGFAHHPTGIKAAVDRGVLTRRETHDGIDVIRTYVYATANKGIARRMISYASFMLSAGLIGAFRADPPDVVIATSPQLLCGCAGYMLARVMQTPFVLEIRDLWPESILAVDAMKENTIVRGLQRVARFLYNNSRHIVTVGSGYKRQIALRYGVPDAHMSVIPNGVDTALFVPGPRNNAVRREFAWGDRFVAMYLGTHGMAHALHIVLDAAALLQNRSDLLFAFVGEGAEKDRLKTLARERNLNNVQFIDQQPKSRVPEFYSACDLGLVTLRDTPLFQEVLPSKIFEFLGMERPILISVAGEARQLVEASGGGRFVPPEDAKALAAAIEQAMEQRVAQTAAGRSGRQYVIEHYDRNRLADNYLSLLEKILRGEMYTP